MNRIIPLLLILLLTCCVSDSFAASAKNRKDALEEKWSKNERLSKIIETSEETIYYFKDSFKKVSPLETGPGNITHSTDSEGVMHFSDGSQKKSGLQEHNYTFWTTKLDKPSMRGKRPGVLKNVVSSTTKWRVDCDNNTYSTPTSSIYNAKGEQIRSIDGNNFMKVAVPDTVPEFIVHFMCERLMKSASTP